MCAYRCPVVGCGVVLPTIAGYRLHVTSHGYLVCGFDDCLQSFGNQPSLTEHAQADHLGYRYACSVCGSHIWHRRNSGASHRRTHPSCLAGVTLQLRPGNGAFYNGQLYRYEVRGAIIRWLAEHCGLTLTREMSEMTDVQLMAFSLTQHAGVPPVGAAGVIVPAVPVAPVVAVQQVAAPAVVPPVAAPVVAPPVVVPEVNAVDFMDDLFARANVARLPVGVVCTQCDPDPELGSYPVFASSLLLCEHIAAAHPDPNGMILVNWARIDDQDEEEVSSSDD